MKLIVDTLTDETGDIRSFRLVRADGAPLPAYEPGAHIDVTGPTGIMRQYSLCGPLSDTKSDEEFLSRLINSSDEDFDTVQKFLTPERKSDLGKAFSEWFMKQSYDMKTKSLGRAPAVAESVGFPKMERILGSREKAKTVWNFAQDMAEVAARRPSGDMHPAVSLALSHGKPFWIFRLAHTTGVPQVLVGSPERLWNWVLKSPKHGEEFRQWAMSGATQEALKQTPALAQLLTTFEDVTKAVENRRKK